MHASGRLKGIAFRDPLAVLCDGVGRIGVAEPIGNVLRDEVRPAIDVDGADRLTLEFEGDEIGHGVGSRGVALLPAGLGPGCACGGVGGVMGGRTPKDCVHRPSISAFGNKSESGCIAMSE